jgi:uncharacterized protein YlxP (DUF503 family)
LYLSQDANQKVRVAMITVNEDVSNIDKSASILEYVDGIPENSRLIKVDTPTVFYTKNCRSK